MHLLTKMQWRSQTCFCVNNRAFISSNGATFIVCCSIYICVVIRFITKLGTLLDYSLIRFQLSKPTLIFLKKELAIALSDFKYLLQLRRFPKGTSKMGHL